MTSKCSYCFIQSKICFSRKKYQGLRSSAGQKLCCQCVARTERFQFTLCIHRMRLVSYSSVSVTDRDHEDQCLRQVDRNWPLLLQLSCQSSILNADTENQRLACTWAHNTKCDLTSWNSEQTTPTVQLCNSLKTSATKGTQIFQYVGQVIQR